MNTERGIALRNVLKEMADVVYLNHCDNLGVEPKFGFNRSSEVYFDEKNKFLLDLLYNAAGIRKSLLIDQVMNETFDLDKEEQELVSSTDKIIESMMELEWQEKSGIFDELSSDIYRELAVDKNIVIILANSEIRGNKLMDEETKKALGIKHRLTEDEYKKLYEKIGFLYKPTYYDD